MGGGRLFTEKLRLDRRRDFAAFQKMPPTQKLFAKSLQKLYRKLSTPIGGGLSDRNSLSWAVQGGGRAILDELQSKRGLKEEKLARVSTEMDVLVCT
ncbi:hypothetical protein DKX38_023201 [Salix brachista]|uniref:Chalcone/stilbene synthase C-terminal domain-containing protein n=1 Tax=Salix brachista TaxID=2182728 RepID=A0A5N5K278_9ROSI|nr:hypothetical protein DKX38_023201 [Salix brachista]